MTYMSRPLLLAALALGLGATDAAAQQSPNAGRAAVADSASSLPALTIGGRVTIRELRVDADPRVEVNLTGCPLAEVIRIDQRANVPEPVVAGVYRDVVIEAHAAVVLADSLQQGQCAASTIESPAAGAAAP